MNTVKQMSLTHDQTPTIDEVMELWQGRAGEWATRKHIADALGRAKSPALISVIGIAVGMGFLERRVTRLPNNVDMFEYRPTGRWRPGLADF